MIQEQTLLLYGLIKHPEPLTPAEITRIYSHPMPTELYQAMMTQSEPQYRRMFIDNPTHFTALTNPLCNPIIVLQTLIQRLAAPSSPDSISTASNSTDTSPASTLHTVTFSTPPTPVRQINSISPKIDR